jgi:hypothetical protein
VQHGLSKYPTQRMVVAAKEHLFLRALLHCLIHQTAVLNCIRETTFWRRIDLHNGP